MTTNPLLPGASIHEGPADWQILQQDPDGHAMVRLRGMHSTQAKRFRVEARAVSETDGTLPPGCPDWQAADLEPGDLWRATLRLPAGGLYRIETRVWRAECPDIRPMRGDYIHHVGVGDLWVIAGQSNASGTGTGPADDPPELGLHQFGNDETWKLASHPLEDATRSRHPVTVHGVFQAHAPWLNFARRLKRELGYPIGLIPCALGGSPIALWQPGAKLHENLVEMVRLAGGAVKGVAWHQGESDAFSGKSSAYADAFRSMVRGVRAALGKEDLPFITGQLALWTSASTPGAHREIVVMREHQRRLARELGHEVVPLLDLPIGDEVHLTAQANLEMGRRYAETALGSVYGRAVRPPGIRLQRVETVGGKQDALRLVFDLGTPGWVKVGDPIGDFSVEDGSGEVPITAVKADDAGWVDLALARPYVGKATVHAHPSARPFPCLRDRDQRPITGFSEVVV